MERAVVQEYSLADYTFKIAELASQGYKPSTENEGFPVSYGLVYVCHMLRDCEASEVDKMLDSVENKPEVNPNQLELDLEVKQDNKQETKPKGRPTKK